LVAIGDFEAIDGLNEIAGDKVGAGFQLGFGIDVLGNILALEIDDACDDGEGPEDQEVDS
jgi:hypothetical protein